MPLLFETTQQTTYCKSRSTQVPDPGRLCPATRLWIVLDCSTPSYCNALGRTTWASNTRSLRGTWGRPAHLKRQVMGREVVVAVTNGRLDGSTELAKVFGT
jgi:hypothetical protein